MCQLSLIQQLYHCQQIDTMSLSGFEQLLYCRDFDTLVGTLSTYALYGKPRGALPSFFHCGQFEFQILCTDAAILPPPPIIRFL